MGGSKRSLFIQGQSPGEEAFQKDRTQEYNSSKLSQLIRSSLSYERDTGNELASKAEGRQGLRAKSEFLPRGW